MKLKEYKQTNANAYFVIDLALVIFLSATQPSAVFLGSTTVFHAKHDDTQRPDVSKPVWTAFAPRA